MSNLIDFSDFAKVEIKIGHIMSCEPVEGSEKLLKLMVDVGESTPRQILSGIAKWFVPSDLLGKKLPFVLNIKPRKMLGFESQGMLLAADSQEGPVLLIPDSDLPAGTLVI